MSGAARAESPRLLSTGQGQESAAGRDSPAARAIAPPLLAWYRQRKRDLPWRREASPYRTLVSEFMLQQTLVAAVIPFFERFISRFPDLPALAAASEDQVVPLWSGLGYYARARNLHRAARAVVERHGGTLPPDERALRELPGVGPYTAAAVAAIAFGVRTFALDGNAARVVARIAAVQEPIDRPATKETLRAVGQSWVPARDAGDFAQAVMELGATVCTPRRPACGDCPLAGPCAARRQRRTDVIPAKAVRAPKRVVRVASLRVRREGRLLLVRRRAGLLAGTWMLPACVVAVGTLPAQAARLALREMGLGRARLQPVGAVRHLFTHRDVTAAVFDVSVGRSVVMKAGPGAAGGADELWIHDHELNRLAISSFVRKQLTLQGDKGDKTAESP